ncbi:transglutaminase-like cysteine peptidase [Pararhizobium sp. BT-229]|uniref:transglutaminase-like cysteine peptidase n=1 Tax=Pararhizobium sp. BT-229 TaxID=2986923 RepID=UPI0021F72A61|nr:transglutaminase-like cysteine peptidase [Pararhizobium sp. BT-229]MCV9964207.1 transglutaminase-like cysteine peptidase [Pararhizobium sp. BT-229]
MLRTLAFLLVATPFSHAEPSSSPGRGGIDTKARAIDGVFGSVAFPMHSAPPAKRWASLLPSITTLDFGACPADSGCGMLRGSISSLHEAAISEKLDTVNRAVNRVLRYQEDSVNYGQMDYWATPEEIIGRGRGDCEDYAILKMAALKVAGVPMGDMSVVVLRDAPRNVHHAVLAVRTRGGYAILDSLNNEVRADGAVHTYEPLYSLASDGMWIHGFRQPAVKQASFATAGN